MAWDQYIRNMGYNLAPFGFAPQDGMTSEDQAFKGGMQFIGDVGMNMLASGSDKPLEAFGRSFQAAKTGAQQQNKDKYIAAQMLQEADAKKQERARAEEERKRRQDFIKTLPPDQQMKAMSVPGYLEKLIEATDPAFQQPKEEKLYPLDGSLVSETGRVVYQGQGSSKAPPTKTIFDPDTGQEQVVQWNGADWVPLGGKKSKGDNRASATELKELWKSEDELPVLDNTIASLTRALELNDKTFTGYTAGIRGDIGTKMPGGGYLVDQNAAAATEEWGKIMSMEAIKNMASTLAGATTDQELKRFVDMLADPNTPPDIRKGVISRMMTLAQQVKAIKTQRINELRGSTANQPADSGGDVPDGVDPDVWNAMTPEERALWQ